MTSKEDLKELKDAFLTIKQEWLEDSNVKLTEWQKNIFDSLEKDLERLKQIDNANPSDALKCLIGLEKEITQRDGYITNFLKIKFNTIKQALSKAQEQDKILEILKKCEDEKHSLYCVYVLNALSSGKISQDDVIDVKEYLDGR